MTKRDTDLKLQTAFILPILAFAWLPGAPCQSVVETIQPWTAPKPTYNEDTHPPTLSSSPSLALVGHFGNLVVCGPLGTGPGT